MDSDWIQIIFENTTLTPAFDLSNKFKWPEYLVFGAVLALSAAIGILYGCFGSKQRTNEEFLMGNRQMSPLPVAMSLLCSSVSAISVLGFPAEIYMYGSQYLFSVLSFVPMTVALTYLYVPVFFELQLTSAYEVGTFIRRKYFELRFNRRVRIAASLISIVYLLCYMSIVVYGPSMALRQVTGINHRISVGIVFVVCIFYSTLGGIKSVVATDAIQGVIMLVSVAAVAGKGLSDVGGIGVVWEKALNTSRIEFLNFDPDPRTRYTIWGSIIGEYFTWIAVYGATQANIQRFVAIPTISKVRWALIYNMLGQFLFLGLLFTLGLVIFAKYSDCDPVTTKQVSTSDQLLPLFVMDTLGDYSGLPGFFVSGVVCASLSTVSSGLNALAAIITEDYIRHSWPKVSDTRLNTCSKVVCVTSGIISYGFTFGAELAENIFPVTSSLIGVMLGPTLGLFSLGMFYPWANWKGSLLGLVTSLGGALFIGLGSVVVGSDNLPDQRLSLDVTGCQFSTNLTYDSRADSAWKENEYSVLETVLSISFVWNAAIGTILCVFLGIIFSIIFKTEEKSVDERCLSPLLLSLWRKLFPEQLERVLKTRNSHELEKPSKL